MASLEYIFIELKNCASNKNIDLWQIHDSLKQFSH